MPATTQRHLRAKPGIAFAELLLIARRRAGLTQQGLADIAGTDRTTIVRWESGLTTTVADPGPLRTTCIALGIRYTDALIALGTLTPADLTPVAA
jgi:DNA-binding XRE family transcriptional regulator